MNASKFKYLHVWLSLALFATCIRLPAYYEYEIGQVVYGFDALLLGWLTVLGTFGPGFYWTANVAYIISVGTCRNRLKSLCFGMLAVGISVAFLPADIVPSRDMNDADGLELITGRGWGYYFWVLSFLILAVGQLIAWRAEKVPVPSAAKIFSFFMTVFLWSGIFYYDYYLRDGSVGFFLSERKSIYDQRCSEAAEHIYEGPGQVGGVAFSTGNAYSYKKASNGLWYQSGDPLGGPLLADQLVTFYEIGRNNDDGLLFERFEMTSDSRAYGDSVSRKPEYEAQTLVSIEPFESERKYNILAETITITTLPANKVIARTSYVYNRTTREFCGPSKDDKFSTLDFVMRVFNTK